MTRRSHERASLHVEVTLESENNFWAGLSNDISEGGVFVATYDPPPVDTNVEVELALPSLPQVRVRGRVCWVRSVEAACEGCPPGCGIEWSGIDPLVLREIARFVAQRDTILFEAA